MDKTGRKRLPLGLVSPSSVPSGQRRRSTPTLSNGSHRSVSNNTKTSNNENKDPNSQPSLISQTGSTNNFGFYSKSQFNPNKHVASSQLSGTSNVIENSQSYLTTSQRRLSFVNLNGNHDPFVSHTTSQITQNKHGVASNSSGCANISGNGQDYLTPSQRRLRSVNLSGITTSGPVSRAIQRKPTTTTNVTPFQLPASRISPTKNFSNKILNPYMTDSSNFRGSGIKDTRIVNLLNRHSMDRNHCITSASGSVFQIWTHFAKSRE